MERFDDSVEARFVEAGGRRKQVANLSAQVRRTYEQRGAGSGEKFVVQQQALSGERRCQQFYVGRCYPLRSGDLSQFGDQGGDDLELGSETQAPGAYEVCLVDHDVAQFAPGSQAPKSLRQTGDESLGRGEEHPLRTFAQALLDRFFFGCRTIAVVGQFLREALVWKPLDEVGAPGQGPVQWSGPRRLSRPYGE